MAERQWDEEQPLLGHRAPLRARHCAGEKIALMSAVRVQLRILHANPQPSDCRPHRMFPPPCRLQSTIASTWTADPPLGLSAIPVKFHRAAAGHGKVHRYDRIFHALILCMLTRSLKITPVPILVTATAADRSLAAMRVPLCMADSELPCLCLPVLQQQARDISSGEFRPCSCASHIFQAVGRGRGQATRTPLRPLCFVPRCCSCFGTAAVKP